MLSHGYLREVRHLVNTDKYVSLVTLSFQRSNTHKHQLAVIISARLPVVVSPLLIIVINEPDAALVRAIDKVKTITLRNSRSGNRVAVVLLVHTVYLVNAYRVRCSILNLNDSPTIGIHNIFCSLASYGNIRLAAFPRSDISAFVSLRHLDG